MIRDFNIPMTISEGIKEISRRGGIALNEVNLLAELVPILKRSNFLSKRYPYPPPIWLMVLLLCWKRKSTNTEINQCTGTGQAAGVVQTLERFGFIFEKGSHASSNRKGKNVERRIVDWDENKMNRHSSRYIAIDLKHRGIFLSGKQCPFTGIGSNLEIDHRKPVSAYDVDGQKVPTLTNAMVDSGESDLYFQALSKSANNAKREACVRCLNGGEIKYPPIFKDPSKLKRNGTCNNCIWHNPENHQIDIAKIKPITRNDEGFDLLKLMEVDRSRTEENFLTIMLSGENGLENSP